MEALQAIGFIFLTMFLVFTALMFVGNIIAALIRFSRRNEKCSEFVGGIARSLVKDSDAWDYDAAENWILSDKYALEISLQGGNFGHINTRNHVNAGSRFILKSLNGPDRRAFSKALQEWRDKTAIERQHRIERWKRDALAAMA